MRVANDLAQLFAAADFGAAGRLLWLITRESYGWGRENCQLTHAEIAERLAIGRRTAERWTHTLTRCRVLLQTKRTGRGNYWEINTKYWEWLDRTGNEQNLPEKILIRHLWRIRSATNGGSDPPTVGGSDPPPYGGSGLPEGQQRRGNNGSLKKRSKEKERGSLSDHSDHRSTGDQENHPSNVQYSESESENEGPALGEWDVPAEHQDLWEEYKRDFEKDDPGDMLLFDDDGNVVGKVPYH